MSKFPLNLNLTKYLSIQKSFPNFRILGLNWCSQYVNREYVDLQIWKKLVDNSNICRWLTITKKCIKFATGAGVERRFWKYYIVICGLSFPPIDFIKFYNRFVFGTNRVLYPSPLPLPLPSASPNSFLCSLNHLL